MRKALGKTIDDLAFSVSPGSVVAGTPASEAYTPKKMLGTYGVKAMHRDAMAKNAGMPQRFGLENIVVVTDGAAYLVDDSTTPTGIFHPGRWIHGARRKMNVLFTDGRVATVSKANVAALPTNHYVYVFYAN